MKSSLSLLLWIVLAAALPAQPLVRYLFDGPGAGSVINSGTLGGSDTMTGHGTGGIAPDGTPCLRGSGVAGDHIDSALAPATDLSTGDFTIGFCLDTRTNASFQYCFGDPGTGWRAFTSGDAGPGNVTMRGAGLGDCVIPGGAGDQGWVHVAWTYDSATGTVDGYLDGLLVNSVTGVTMTHNGAAASSLDVAGYQGPGGLSTFLLGSQMEDFRVYGSVLTPSDIATWACGCLQGLLVVSPWEENDPKAAMVTDGVSQPAGNEAIKVTRPLGSTVTIDLQSTLVGNPFEIVYTVGSDVAVPAYAGGLWLLGCPESAVLNIPFAAPTFSTVFGLSFTTPFAPISIPVAPTTPLQISYQMGVVDPAAAIGVHLSAATDLNIAPPPCVTVAADGANLLGTSGAWTVSHSGSCADSILSVTIDTFNARPGSPASFVFWDTDQLGMADRFDGGNSAVAGCSGTYRGGSDVSCGLIYDALNTPTACGDPLANTGWIGTNAVGPNEYGTLQFRFTPGSFNGVTFQWDMDPDYSLGGGDSGAHMDGCFVSVTTTSGTFSGYMIADSFNAQRAFIDLF